jgi:predicted phosphodiesterase
MKNHDVSTPKLSIGIVADLQYCDTDPEMNRYFRNAPQKLSQVAEVLNKHKPNFVVNLGDTIDHDWQSFDGIMPLFQKFESRIYHVLGNHDYEVKDQYKPLVHEKLETEKYYSFSDKGWRFVVLDGNEISTFANLKGSNNYELAEQWLGREKINSNFWNGGIGSDQLVWLEQQLREADESKENVIIFCHFPVYPEHRHNLLNDRELLSLLENHHCVKAWINGHNHDGNYDQVHNIHFLNVKGIVDFEFELAFCLLRIYDHHLEIEGFGNEISARLTF